MNQGFTFVELMIAVAILGIIAAIAVPMYTGYITSAKQSAAKAVMDQMPVLVETYRADNGTTCPACNANGAYTYTYSENNDGTVNVDTITTNYPNFKAKSSSQTAASLYHYQIVFTVAGCPACTTSAVTTALPQTGRGAPAGNIVSNPF
jgi:prepilin-type N-terminal cleavage/methylation domain-containing protein